MIMRHRGFCGGRTADAMCGSHVRVLINTKLEPTSALWPSIRPLPQATRTGYACLVRRTGQIAGWREWRENRAGANRYSQEERVTSHCSRYADHRAMSNVIGFSP